MLNVLRCMLNSKVIVVHYTENVKFKNISLLRGNIVQMPKMDISYDILKYSGFVISNSIYRTLYDPMWL